jgi:hypothetical protein
MPVVASASDLRSFSSSGKRLVVVRGMERRLLP